MTTNQKTQKLLTKKQSLVLNSYLHDDWKILVLNGAVRSGKTFINNFIFMYEMRRVARLAASQGDLHPRYILAGYSNGTIYNNVISELENTFGFDMRPDRHGHFHLFGVDIVPAYTGNERGTRNIRGMTSYGAYINETSLATHSVFEEIVYRCSKEGARIICDTNPDSPEHWLKKDYIDNAKPEAKIKSFRFTLDDNTFLPKDYVTSLKASTPSGMFYDRAILGLWVSGEGVVYADFDKQRMAVDKAPDNLHYYVGVDWGFEHKNSIVVFGDDDDGNTYLLEEHTGKHQFIDHWIEIAKGIQKRYGKSIRFYCDSARPEHVQAFRTAGLMAQNADKTIMAGVETVGSLMRTGKFYYVKGQVEEFLNEIYQYVWDEKTGEPLKDHDDVMDAMRYAIYTRHKRGMKMNIVDKPRYMWG